MIDVWHKIIHKRSSLKNEKYVIFIFAKMLIFELPTCEILFIVLDIGLLYYKYTIQVYFTYLFLNY
jgi:hypothetical protein